MSDATFQNVSTDPKLAADQLDSFRAGAGSFVQKLYDVSNADIGELVPYIKISEISPTGQTIGKPITNEMYTPPEFGASVGSEQFGERPNLSIENITVKSVNPRGWKLFRQIDLNITVHRPDAVFGTTQNTAAQKMLNFNSELLLEYGWRGPPGNPFSDGVNERTTQGQQFSFARNQLRFKIVNYNFQLQQTGEIKFQIHGIENGELASRNITIFDNVVYTDVSDKGEDWLKQKVAVYKKNLREASQRSNSVARTKLKNNKQKFIKLIDVFNVLFAKSLNFIADMGQFDERRFEFGLFNEACPPMNKSFAEQSVSNTAIGDLFVPLDTVLAELGKATSTNPMTVDALIQMMLDIVRTPVIWEHADDLKYRLPELMIRTVFDPNVQGKKTMLFQIVDRKRYLPTKSINSTDTTVRNDKEKYKRYLKQFTTANNIPIVSLYKQGSFIQTANFSVTSDDQMKSAFMYRTINRTRGQLTTRDPSGIMNFSSPGVIAVLYRSAIKGDITMLGNFCFEQLGTMWIDFGIWAYDGVFYVMQKTDNVSSTGFTTTISVIAEGSDPLGVGLEDQSRLDAFLRGAGVTGRQLTAPPAPNLPGTVPNLQLTPPTITR